MDEKYAILKHPNVALTADGKGNPYEHGKTDHASGTTSLGSTSQSQATDPATVDTDTFELLSSEEIEALFHLD